MTGCLLDPVPGPVPGFWPLAPARCFTYCLLTGQLSLEACNYGPQPNHFDFVLFLQATSRPWPPCSGPRILVALTMVEVPASNQNTFTSLARCSLRKVSWRDVISIDRALTGVCSAVLRNRVGTVHKSHLFCRNLWSLPALRFRRGCRLIPSSRRVILF